MTDVLDELKKRVELACREHGAKAVSDAAYAAMSGNRAGLDRVKLGDVKGIGDLDVVGSTAHKLMEPDEQALDLAQATIGLMKHKRTTK
jgi:hypothetical protein